MTLSDATESWTHFIEHWTRLLENRALALHQDATHGPYVERRPRSGAARGGPCAHVWRHLEEMIRDKIICLRAVCGKVIRYLKALTLIGERLAAHPEPCASDEDTSVFVDTESYYLFAEVLLDAAASAAEYLFGYMSCEALGSHDELTRNLEGIARRVGWRRYQPLLQLATAVQSAIVEHREQPNPLPVRAAVERLEQALCLYLKELIEFFQENRMKSRLR